MKLQHPLDFVPLNRRRRLFFVFVTLTIIAMVIMQILDIPLRTQAAPAGIVSFELAGSLDRARQIVGSWGRNGLINASFGLGFDFLFMPLYAMSISMLTLLIRDRKESALGMIRNILGWGPFGAAIFDSVENISLLSVLHGLSALPFSQLAAVCAAAKFGLILVCLLYGSIGWLFSRNTTP